MIKGHFMEREFFFEKEYPGVYFSMKMRQRPFLPPVKGLCLRHFFRDNGGHPTREVDLVSDLFYGTTPHDLHVKISK